MFGVFCSGGQVAKAGAGGGLEREGREREGREPGLLAAGLERAGEPNAGAGRGQAQAGSWSQERAGGEGRSQPASPTFGLLDSLI